MLFNIIKNNKILTWGKRVKILIATCFYFLMSTVQASDLIGIAYNTIHNDQIELVFSFSEEIYGQPSVQN